MPYSIIRFFQNADNETIGTDLTLEEARAHCRDPETSSSTCTGIEGLNRTESNGDWFDGFAEE